MKKIQDTTGCVESDIRDEVANYQRRYDEESCRILAAALRELAEELESAEESAVCSVDGCENVACDTLTPDRPLCYPHSHDVANGSLS